MAAGIDTCIFVRLQEVEEAMRAALKPEDLAKYSIVGRDDDFEETLGGKIPASGIISLKSEKRKAAPLYKKEDGSRKQKGKGGKPGGPKKRKS